jgi:cell division protein FtsZ
MADEVLQQGVRGITDLMVMPGLINLDFADVRSVMQEMGKAMMGTGEAEGDDRALVAAQKAINNPLLDGVSMQGAKGVIISITGGEDMRLLEVDEAANHIRELVDPEANIIWGSAFNPDLEGKIRVSVVATGIEAEAANVPAAEPTRAFSFSTPRKPAEPVSFAPPAAEAASEEHQSAELEAQPMDEAVAPAEPEPAPMPTIARFSDLPEDAVPPAADATDELVLGAEAAVPPAGEPAPGEEPVVRRRWISPGSVAASEAASAPAAAAEPQPEPAPAPKPKIGGTLFERMSNVTRGAAREDTSSDREPLDIPRFLHRQNNQ